MTTEIAVPRTRTTERARTARRRRPPARAPRILVVEDEAALALLLAYNLEAEGFIVERVERGDEAELRLDESPPDLVILDWMLPGRLRPRDLPPPARRARRRADPAGDHADRARRGGRARARPLGRRRRLCRQAVFGAGADGAGAGAAAPLAARSRRRAAHRRRPRPRSRDPPGPPRAAATSISGPTEFRLLEYLMEKPGRVFSRSQLLDSVWGFSAEIDERTVDVHVGRLRKALAHGQRGARPDPHRARRRLFLRRDFWQGDKNPAISHSMTSAMLRHSAPARRSAGVSVRRDRALLHPPHARLNRISEKRPRANERLLRGRR